MKAWLVLWCLGMVLCANTKLAAGETFLSGRSSQAGPRPPQPLGAHTTAQSLEQAANRQVEANQFQKDRLLGEYLLYFGKQFAKELSALGPDDGFYDGGGGNHFATEGYHRRVDSSRYPNRQLQAPDGKWYLDDPDKWHRCTGEDLRYISETLKHLDAKSPEEKAWVTSLTFRCERPANYPTPLFDGKLRPLEKKFFDDWRSQKIVEKPYGKSKLITDVYGIAAYSKNAGEVYTRYINDLLRDDGTLYVYNPNLPKWTVNRIAFATWLGQSAKSYIVTSSGRTLLQGPDQKPWPGLTVTHDCNPEYVSGCMVIRKNLPSNLSELCQGERRCRFEIELPEIEAWPEPYSNGKEFPPIFQYYEKQS